MKSIDIITLKMIREKGEEYNTLESISNPSVAYKIMKDRLQDATEEQFWILCLDTKNKPCGLHMVSQGSLNSSIVHPREVFKRALCNNALSIILYHNHPSGDTRPSQEDKTVTKRLVDAGNLLGVDVMEHIIIGDNKYLSMREEGLM